VLSSESPRILFAANLYPEHNFMMQRYESIVAALEGYDVTFIDILDFFGDHERAMELERMCFDGKRLRRFFDEADIVDLNRNFLNHVLSYEWDILCLCTISHYSYFLLPDTLRALSQERKLVVGFFGDDETMLSSHKFWVRLFDAVVAYSEHEVRQYQQWNSYTYLLPIGLGKLPDVPQDREKDIDVIFVGRPYGTRVEMIRAIKASGIGIQVFGSKSWLDYPDLEDVYQGFLERDAFWQQIGRAKVILNLMEDTAGKPHINAKVFEAAMVGAFSLVTCYPPFETTYGLEDEKSVAFYHSTPDLVAKLEYYLTHEEHREQIAHQLQCHLLMHFTYEKLYKNLFSKLESQWRDGVSQSVFRQSVEMSPVSVIQFVSNKLDYQNAQQVWSAYRDASVIYVSNGRFSHPNVYSMTEFRRQLGERLSPSLREYIALATPQTIYDPVTFSLIRQYGTDAFFRDGVYCNSIAQGKRLCKSIHLIDLGSSIWRRDAFLRHAATVLRWYRLTGGIVPRRMAKFDLALMPLFLNAVSDARTVATVKRAQWALDVARRWKHRQ
jgi:hypothetical protein